MEGYYSEKLPCGGELKIYKDYWYIEYYFSGPDLRYNGQIFRIRGENIEEYIVALKDNFLEYQELKKQNITGKMLSKPVKMNMTIRLAPFSEGVCLFGHHKAIATQKQLERIVASYQYASKKALEVTNTRLAT
jgi:hypothetical protein